ncbi:MAG: cysteine desulfurase family protein [Geminicoccaceae bacterium]
MIVDRTYLDYNATAPVKPEVIALVAETMSAVGNASSVHTAGRAARGQVDKARARIGALVKAAPEQVTFTSGGTEANNQALASADGPVLTSVIEHESVLRAAGARPAIAVDDQGRLDLGALDAAIEAEAPAMISVMLANNETGVLQPIADIAARAVARGILLHVDAIQACGKQPVDMGELGADFLSLSAHKFGGPQGIGALITRPGLEPRALIKGGAQEHRRRAGTENVAAIAGFGLAAELAATDTTFSERVQRLRDRMEAGIRAIAPAVRIFGEDAPRLPNTSCLTMPGVSHETQLIAFDLKGIAVSSGAACSSGKVGPSLVLAAMGVPDQEAGTAIRVSFGWDSEPSDVDRFLEAFADLFNRQRSRREAELVARTG